MFSSPSNNNNNNNNNINIKIDHNVVNLAPKDHRNQSSSSSSIPPLLLSKAIQQYGFVSVFPSIDVIRDPQLEREMEQQQQQEQIKNNNNNNNTKTSVGENDDSSFQKQQLIKPLKNKINWSCIKCNNHISFGPKCTSCGGKKDNNAIRVFVGKLNREGAAETCHALLNSMVLKKQMQKTDHDSSSSLSSTSSSLLTGDGGLSTILHVEPHTHSRNGRGKGCTWVYVRTPQDVLTIVNALHERTFICLHPETKEVGFVPFPSSVDDETIEAAFQQDHFTNREHFVHFVLHNARVTAEVPQNMKEEIGRKLQLCTSEQNSAVVAAPTSDTSSSSPSSILPQKMEPCCCTDDTCQCGVTTSSSSGCCGSDGCRCRRTIKNNTDTTTNNKQGVTSQKKNTTTTNSRCCCGPPKKSYVVPQEQRHQQHDEDDDNAEATIFVPPQLPERPVFMSKSWFAEDKKGLVRECLDDDDHECRCADCKCGCPDEDEDEE